MISWLVKNGFLHSPQMRKHELLQLSKYTREEPKMVVDDINEDSGHKHIHLVPECPDLNPIELVCVEVN